MTTNASPEYAKAEKRYSECKTDEERLVCLEEMISHAPAHKGGENLRANLRSRYKRFTENVETKRRASGKGKAGIKKDEMQLVIVGLPNTGKSHLFKVLTNQESYVSEVPFSTKEPKLGMTDYQDVKIQTIDMPPFPNEDRGVINNTDTLLIVIDKLSPLEETNKFVQRSNAKKIYILNKTDLLNETERRKLEATIKTKHKNVTMFLFSCEKHTDEELEFLKKTIFETFPIIRIYTKEPRKDASKTPMIMKKGSTLKEASEKILKGMSKMIKRARIWGPSSKFPGQTIGLSHILKDKDVIEFQTI